MLKKLGGAVLVAAFALAGMSASTALALKISRPEPVGAPFAALAAKAQPVLARAKRTPRRAPHPWDDACAAAKVDAQLLVATSSVNSPDEYASLAREGIAVNVRLLVALRRTPLRDKSARALLARLERSIYDDRIGLERFERGIDETQFVRWLRSMEQDNAELSALSARAGARGCVDYFRS